MTSEKIERSHRTSKFIKKATCLLLLGAALVPTSGVARNLAFEKVALIIGNSDYSGLPDLPNASNDAVAVTEMLSDAGYLVFTKIDVTKTEFSATIAEISSRLNQDSEVVFFFAGHGFQIGSENFLLPTDAEISELKDVPLESVSLTHVLEHLSTVAGTQIALLDSCRDNPFAGQQAFAGLGPDQLTIENGFSFQSAPVNSLISFSTAPGSLALDGTGDNSPYTASLINTTAAHPEFDIARLLPIMRAQVFEETNGFQVPWESSSLLKPVYLSARDATPAAAAQPIAPTVIPETAPQAPSDLLISVNGVVQKHVPLFEDETTRSLGTGTDLVVETVPQAGWLGIVEGNSVRPLSAGDVVSSTQVAALTYSPSLEPQTTTRGLRPVTDVLEIKRGATKVKVDIDLSYHACDKEAASPQDAQGVGLAVEIFEMDPEKAVAACTEAVAQFPNESRFHYQLGRALSTTADLAGAEASMQRALELGHIRAIAGLGQVKFIETDDNVADNTGPVRDDILQTYIEGHRAGDILATYLLGRNMIRHGATPSERQQGFSLLQRANDVGFNEALNELGRHFLVSTEGDANPLRGEQYFLESARRGNYQGHNSLGLIYKNGIGGLEVSFDKAVMHFSAAADLKHPTAPTSLGRIWSEGRLVTPDFPQALDWYDEGLSRGDPWGGTNGANLIILDKISGKSRVDAAVRLAKAATIGAGDAQAAAMDLLGKLTRKELAGGLQSLLVELGEPVSVDGIPGGQTERAFIEVYGGLVPLRSRQDMQYALEKIAEVYWERSGFRRDLN